jgi:hypothetical protein
VRPDDGDVEAVAFLLEEDALELDELCATGLGRVTSPRCSRRQLGDDFHAVACGQSSASASGKRAASGSSADGEDAAAGRQDQAAERSVVLDHDRAEANSRSAAGSTNGGRLIGAVGAP